MTSVNNIAPYMPLYVRQVVAAEGNPGFEPVYPSKQTKGRGIA